MLDLHGSHHSSAHCSSTNTAEADIKDDSVFSKFSFHLYINVSSHLCLNLRSRDLSGSRYHYVVVLYLILVCVCVWGLGEKCKYIHNPSLCYI
jgi:hypothetical protein